jgi:protoheme IX farnesyltransferase
VSGSSQTAGRTPSAGIARSDRQSVLLDLVALTRPRILVLVLLTAPPALALGGEGWPDAATTLGVMAGTILLGAGCSAVNAWWERDRDARMERTEDRPLPAGRLQPGQALAFGVVVLAGGLLALLATGGTLAAGIGLAATAHYLLVYTLWLKPRHAIASLIGGATGAAAPLIADAAVDGMVGVWGVTLFAIVFLWQPPHVWAIHLYRQREYENAGFPVFPTLLGRTVTRRWMLTYALALVPVTLLPWIAGALGPICAMTAAAGALLYCGSIVRAMRHDDPIADRQVFVCSIPYLGTLMLVMLGELLLA